ncbi:MAG TPA: carotenoid oxygenase family protein [Thermoanaerobaculia bacterium]|nr:carotenoid oxygenase family protein [Thermoanaerobaculia bacterium]
MSADFAPGLEKAFELIPEEQQGEVAVEGRLPDWLSGSYLGIGPARFRRGEMRYRHWLDGDGMVFRLCISAAGAQLTTRWLASPKQVEEEAAGRFLYRTFGTSFEGDRLVRNVALATPVNVSVYPFAGKLLAFGEQGLPWELDPTSLETLGEHTFERRLNHISPFSAHPNFDPDNGEMVNFGISFATTEPTLTLYRFSADGQLIYRRRHALDLPASVHDFSLSPRWAAVHVAPYLLDMKAFLERGASVQEALGWHPERGSRLWIFDRESGDLASVVPVGQGYCLHHINAFEQGENLVVDLLELSEPVYPDYQPLPDLFVDVEPGRPVRLVVDPRAGRLLSRRELPFAQAADFAAIDPHLAGKGYRWFWMLSVAHTGRNGRKFLDRLVRGDWQEGRLTEMYAPAPGRYLAAEPAFVAGLGSTGVVLVPELDVATMTTTFLLLDAFAEPGAAPLARLTAPKPMNLAFHTCWQAA